MNLKALINKEDKILKKYQSPDRKVFKRVITRTGGDQLIGRPASVAYSDTELYPQPTYQRGGRTTMTGMRSPSEYVVVGGRALTPDMALFIMSPTSITRAELENPNLVLVVNDSAGHSEVFQITDFDAPPAGDVLFQVFAKSIGR